MSRLTLSRKKHIRHPNFLQKHQKGIGISLIVFGIGELIITCYIMFFIPDPFVSPIPVSFTGKRPEIDDTNIQNIKKLLTKHDIYYDQVYMTKDGDYLIKMRSSGEVLFSKSIDIERNISSLQLVLARITMEGKQFSRLDFRFEKPVIVFK